MLEPISSAQMAALDENCEYLGLSRLQLMENAGCGLARAVLGRFPQGGRLVVVSGLGNNGGDGFVAARHLAAKFEVRVILLGRKKDISTPEARRNFQILEKTCETGILEVRDSSQLEPGLFEADVIIDAILGTGVKGSIRQPASDAIDLINRSNAYVISVDVPSGLDPDTGASEKAVKPNLTVTFHRPKPALKDLEIEVIDIGIPPLAEKIVGPGDLRPLLKRSPESRKGDNGRILVIGGGAYTGAPALAALAALRTGADLVTIATPQTTSQTISSFSPNLIVRELEGDTLKPSHIRFLKELAANHHTVLLGPGLGRTPQTLDAIKELTPHLKRAVIDADALHALPPKLEGEIILTPHAGELQAITGRETLPGWQERLETVENAARTTQAVVLLKGAVDVISDGTTTKINRTGNSGMTVGGTGDVLAGITAALLTKNPPLQAATAAAFLNGRAGDLAYQEKGTSLLATDIIEKIPEALKLD